MLQLKVEVTGVALDATSFDVRDTTGSYNVSTNPGGYGTPNPAFASFEYTDLELKLYNKLEKPVLQASETETPGTVSALVAGKKVDWTFSDGVYRLTMLKGLKVEPTSFTFVSGQVTIDPASAITGMNAAAPSHISVQAHPYNRSKIIEVNDGAGTIKYVTDFPAADLVAPDFIVLWWSAETWFMSTHKTGLALAKKMGSHSCDCQLQLNDYCMLLRAKGLFDLGDYRSASLLIDNLKNRLLC